jgi:hypothetical protein
MERYKIQYNRKRELVISNSFHPAFYPKKFDYIEMIVGENKSVILVNNNYGRTVGYRWSQFDSPAFKALCFDTEGDICDDILIALKVQSHLMLISESCYNLYDYDVNPLFYFGIENPEFNGDWEIVECPDLSLPIYCNSYDLHHSQYDGEFYRYEENTPEYQEREEEEEEEDKRDYYTDEYHSNGTKYYPDIIDNRFRIGFEIEKEDEDVKESITISDFRSVLPLWRKERDGSLDDSSGYELISPVFPLDVNLIEEHIKSSHILKSHINADFSDSCGGHINISDSNSTPETLYDNLSGYFSILYALYPKRVSHGYCKGYSKDYMKKESGKRLAINMKNDRIELRIFPAVRSVKNLLFRLRLVEFMMQNPATCLGEIDFYRLNKILSEIHDTEEKKFQFMERVTKYEETITNNLEAV